MEPNTYYIYEQHKPPFNIIIGYIDQDLNRAEIAFERLDIIRFSDPLTSPTTKVMLFHEILYSLRKINPNITIEELSQLFGNHIHIPSINEYTDIINNEVTVDKKPIRW